MRLSSTPSGPASTAHVGGGSLLPIAVVCGHVTGLSTRNPYRHPRANGRLRFHLPALGPPESPSHEHLTPFIGEYLGLGSLRPFMAYRGSADSGHIRPFSGCSPILQATNLSKLRCRPPDSWRGGKAPCHYVGVLMEPETSSAPPGSNERGSWLVSIGHSPRFV